MARISLSAATLLFAVVVLRYGGVEPADWYWAMAALGLISIVGASSGRSGDAPAALPWPVRIGLAALAAVAFLQVVPVPARWVAVLCPPRFAYEQRLAEVLEPRTRVSLSLNPTESFRWALSTLAFICWFLLARQLVWKYRRNPWLVMLPFCFVAVGEAVLGVVQVLWAGAPLAQGTYANRNHFAGLLELALPLLLVYGLLAYRRGYRRRETPLKPAVVAGAAWGAAAVLMMGIVLSLSRGGFAAALFSILFLAVVSLSRSWSRVTRIVFLALAAAAVVAGFLYLPTDALIARFAALAETEEISADTRVQIWSDTIRMIRDYWLVGCGLGAFKSGLMPYRTAAPMNTVDFAHNDFLQLLAEFGVAGFLWFAGLGLRAWANALWASQQPSERVRLLGIACCGSLAAITLHSLVDFNLYVPANALLVTWIAGVSEGLRVPGSPVAGQPPWMLEAQSS